MRERAFLRKEARIAVGSLAKNSLEYQIKYAGFYDVRLKERSLRRCSRL